MEIHAALVILLDLAAPMEPSSSNAGRTNPDKSFLYRGLAVMSVLLTSIVD